MPTKILTEAPPERSRSWLWLLCGILLTATFLNYSNRFAVTQNALPVQESFNISEEGYGRLAGYFGLGFACGGLVFGCLADVMSVRWLYAILVVVFSLAGISHGLVSSFVGLGVARFVLGFFEAGHWPCALRTTQRAFAPDQRTWANSLLQSGASLGAVFTPLLVVGLYSWDPQQWRLSFFIVGALGLPWAVWWLVSVRESDVRRPVIQTDEFSEGSGEQRELQEIPFSMVFRTRRWWLLLIVVVCINTVWHYIRVWMPVMLQKDHGYSANFVQYFTSAYYAVTFLGALASGALTAKLARANWNVHRARLTVFLLFALMASVAIPAAFMPAGIPLLASLLVVAFGSLGLFPIYYSLNQEISARNQGKVGGTLGFSTWALLYFVHPTVGRLVDNDPTIRPYLFAGVALGPLLAFAVLACFWGKRPTVTDANDFTGNKQNHD